VFQRRGGPRRDRPLNFSRSWADYRAGFGDLEGEFWLGNDLIHSLTFYDDDDGGAELRIELEDFEGVRAVAKYSYFMYEVVKKTRAKWPFPGLRTSLTTTGCG